MALVPRDSIVGKTVDYDSREIVSIGAFNFSPLLAAVTSTFLVLAFSMVCLPPFPVPLSSP